MSAFANLKLNDMERRELNGSTEWQDVTKEMFEACGKLGVGGMRKRDGFTLQDSMNALELMSPKMDAGMNLDKLLTVKEKYEKGLVSIPPKLDTDLVAVCDLIMCMEMAWYNGHSLATSVHSCIFLSEDSLQILRDKATPLLHRLAAEGPDGYKLTEEDSDEEIMAVISLITFLTILKTCFLVRKLVRLADIYEEEDFVAAQHGLPLADDVAVENLNELIEKIKRLILQRQMIPSSPSRSAFSSDGIEALASVVDYRKTFLNMTAMLLQPELAGIKIVERLVLLLKEQHDSKAGPRHKGKLGQVTQAFKDFETVVIDPDTNKKLIASSPPRARPLIDPESSQKQFASFLENIGRLCKLMEQESLRGLYAALEEFSQFEPCIVARSAVVLILLTENKLALGKYSYSDWVMKDMISFGVPVYEVHTEVGRGFAEAMTKPIYELLILLTANRARLRRNLANNLPGWGSIQQEAELHDQLTLIELRPELKDIELNSMEPKKLSEILHFSMHSWVVEWTIRIMILHLHLGFELELYAKHEFEIMYWYMSFLYNCHRDNRAEMTKFLGHKMQQILQGSTLAAVGSSIAPPSDGKKKRTAALQAAQKSIQIQIEEQFVSIKSEPIAVKESVVSEIKKLLSDGLLRVLIALRKQGKLVHPVFEFGSPKIRYNHRFKPYSTLPHPGILPFDSYEKTTDASKYDSDTLFSHSKDFFDRCKELIMRVVKSGSLTEVESESIKALLKVVISNSVFILREQAEPSASSDKTIQFDFSRHSSFPILSYTSKTTAE